MSDIGAAREAVRQIGLRLVETGLVVGTWGNVSVRVGDRMVVTPSGADYAALAAEDMPVVDLATGEWEGPKPSSERDLHRAVYLERREINAVIHAHSPNASTLAAARRELPPILDDVAQLIGPSVRVADYAAATDGGAVVLPQGFEQQIQGGVAQGLGLALMEDCAAAQGRLLTRDFSTYLIPTALDLPDIESVAVDSFEPSGPGGLKGVGEVAANAPLPALASAVEDAAGVRLDAAPLTPERVLAALGRGRRR